MYIYLFINSKNYKDIFQMESYLPRICLSFNIKEEKKNDI